VADQNLDIVIRVRGGQVASSEIQGVSKATAQVGTTTEETTKKTSKLGQQLKGIATGIAVYKGYQFLKGAVSETASLAKSTAGLQRITGLDTKTAAGWVATAQERGIQSKQLNLGFVTLARNINSAANGSKASKQAFAALGLDAAGLKAQDARTQMGMLADSFKAIPSAADRATLAQKLFGRQGQALLPLLQQGSKGLNEQMDAMGKSTGITDKSLKSGLNLVKQQREMNAAMLGVKVAIGTALIPVITGLTTALVPLAQGFAKLMQQSPVFRTAIYAITAALIALKVAMFFGADVATGGIIGLIIGLGTALVLAYNKVTWFHNAVDTAFRAIKTVIGSVINWIKGNWPIVVTLLLGPIAGAVALIIKHFGTVKSVVSDALHAIESVAKSVGGAIGSVLGGAFNGVKSAVDGVTGAIRSMINTAKSIASLPGKVGGLIGKGISAVGGVVGIGQAGGTVPAGGRYTLVGERGPELVALPGGTEVIPNHVLNAFGSGGGGGTHHITVPVYLDRRQVGLAMGDYVADQQAAK
jgi:hypothetical protein